MKVLQVDASKRELVHASPYDTEPVRSVGNPVAQAGLSAAEMVCWLAIMAVLSVGMILLLWNASRA